MQVSAVLKARTLAFIEIDELNRLGKVRLSEILPSIVLRYDFDSYPDKAQELDLEDKGVVFGSGRLGDIVIDELKIFSGVIYVETLSSTEDSRSVLMNMLNWGKEELGLTYEDGMIRQWAYVSQITFYSEVALLRAMNTPLDTLARKTSLEISNIFGEEITYSPLNYVIGHDPRTRKNPIASLTIQQRANVKFDDNKFFSEAPLPTDTHIKFLEELEQEVIGLKK